MTRYPIIIRLSNPITGKLLKNYYSRRRVRAKVAKVPERHECDIIHSNLKTFYKKIALKTIKLVIKACKILLRRRIHQALNLMTWRA